MKTSDQLLEKPSAGRILVVDDEEKNRRLLGDLLTAQGYTVRTATNGMEALLQAHDFQPETILLDIMMPTLDGLEVCRRLKNDPETNSIPILLATALRERSDRIHGLEAGADDFLTKPLDTGEVSLRVKTAIHSKQLHDRLQAAYRDLQALETLRDNLTHMIIHDLRSPLTVVAVSFELILPEIKRFSPESQDVIAMAQNSCLSLIEMVSSLLDVSRMEAGQMPLSRTSCDLKEVAMTAAGSMKAAALQKELVIEVTGKPAPCSADRELIRRVFINLLANAIKFSPAGKTVVVAVSSRPESVHCSVTDSGHGIPPEYHQRIFDKFGQVESRSEGKVYSTGLGLTFCKLAVEAHRGRIGVVSEVGKGSTFWFELPAA